MFHYHWLYYVSTPTCPAMIAITLASNAAPHFRGVGDEKRHIAALWGRFIIIIFVPYNYYYYLSFWIRYTACIFSVGLEARNCGMSFWVLKTIIFISVCFSPQQSMPERGQSWQTITVDVVIVHFLMKIPVFNLRPVALSEASDSEKTDWEMVNIAGWQHPSGLSGQFGRETWVNRLLFTNSIATFLQFKFQILYALCLQHSTEWCVMISMLWEKPDLFWDL